MTFHDLDTPAVLIDLDIVEHNVKRMAAYASSHSLRLRPHTKTHKLPDLAKLQIANGAQGITVAKVGEAEIMADSGIGEILIAYPILGPAKLARLTNLARRIRCTVALDSFDVALKLSEAAVSAGVSIRLRAEFDTGFGRCGLPVEKPSMTIVRRMLELPNLIWDGIQTYPGHIMANREQRPAMIRKENQVLSELLSLLHTADIPVPVLSGGNTPAAFQSHEFHRLTEMRPGTYIFNDKNTVCSDSAAYADCAVTVLSTVISNAVQGRAVVDAGSKSLSADQLLSGDKQGFGYLPEFPLIRVCDLSEEHGHLDITGSDRVPNVGEPVRIIPNHVCPCVNLFDTVYGIRGEEVITEWMVAGRGKVQ